MASTTALPGLERHLFGSITKAAERLGISLRTDLRDHLVAWLSRQVQRAYKLRRQTIKLQPTLDARKWRQDAARGLTANPKSSRSIQTYRSRLVQLGLIEAIDHGDFWLIKFKFSLATLESLLLLKRGGKVSGSSLLGNKGDSPLQGNPPCSEDALAGTAEPQRAAPSPTASARPQTDTAGLRPGCAGDGIQPPEEQPETLQELENSGQGDLVAQLRAQARQGVEALKNSPYKREEPERDWRTRAEADAKAAMRRMKPRARRRWEQLGFAMEVA